MSQTLATRPPRFSIVCPIGGDLIVVDRVNGIAKTVSDSAERDLWLHGLLEQSHAQLLKAFYPNGEALCEFPLWVFSCNSFDQESSMA
jgi:hypothetical protein